MEPLQTLRDLVEALEPWRLDAKAHAALERAQEVLASVCLVEDATGVHQPGWYVDKGWAYVNCDGFWLKRHEREGRIIVTRK